MNVATNNNSSTMVPSIDDELQIPPTASLPVEATGYSLKAESDESNSVEISMQTSLRPSARCWLVGRQAATADLRIQHGSISRKHAALYLLNDQLMLQDLGGKHGTHVNGQMISKTSVALKQGDSIMFGNVREQIFTVQIPAPGTALSSAEIENVQTLIVQPSGRDDKSAIKDAAAEKPEAAKTRSGREAEIAAMVASFDQKATYTKFKSAAVAPADGIGASGRTAKQVSVAKKHGLPIAEEFHVDEDNSSGDSKNKQSLSSLVVDKSGSRFAVGRGPHLKLYDFSGMNRTRTTPFKTILVEDGYNVEHVCYSNSGDRILVATASPQPSVFDRDGELIVQFVRGDQYVMDMAKTTGHVNAITGVDWHPFDRDIVLTCSLDGSARLWNLKGKTVFYKLTCDTVYRIKSARGQRTGITATAFHPGGREFAVGTSCGSVQIWNSTKVGMRPERVKYDAHGAGKPISAIVYNQGGTQIATRSIEDDVVHVWDAKKLSKSAKPVASCLNVSTVHERTSCDFSPNGKYLVVGSSDYEKNSQGQRQAVGAVKMFAISPTQRGVAIDEVPTKSGLGVVHVKWHAKLNQILAGCSDGSVLVLFDDTMSRNGAMISVAKASRVVDGLTALLTSRASQHVNVGEIVAPFASRPGGNKRKNEQDDGEPTNKSRRPEPPARGIKVGGQSSASATFTQFVSKSIMHKEKKMVAGKDPREDLFRYHDETKTSGDKPLLADKTVEQEEDERMSKET